MRSICPWTDTRPTRDKKLREQPFEAGIAIEERALVVSTDDHPEICGDRDGMIALGPNALLLSNDCDCGIEGAATQFWLIQLVGGEGNATDLSTESLIPNPAGVLLGHGNPRSVQPPA